MNNIKMLLLSYEIPSMEAVNFPRTPTANTRDTNFRETQYKMHKGIKVFNNFHIVQTTTCIRSRNR